MIRRRPRTYTAQATADRWLVTFAAEDIVRAEWESIPANVRALTEHRLQGDIARGLER